MTVMIIKYLPVYVLAHVLLSDVYECLLNEMIALKVLRKVSSKNQLYRSETLILSEGRHLGFQLELKVEQY